MCKKEKMNKIQKHTINEKLEYAFVLFFMIFFNKIYCIQYKI